MIFGQKCNRHLAPFSGTAFLVWSILLRDHFAHNKMDQIMWKVIKCGVENGVKSCVEYMPWDTLAKKLLNWILAPRTNQTFSFHSENFGPALVLITCFSLTKCLLRNCHSRNILKTLLFCHFIPCIHCLKLERIPHYVCTFCRHI